MKLEYFCLWTWLDSAMAIFGILSGGVRSIDLFMLHIYIFSVLNTSCLFSY